MEDSRIGIQFRLVPSRSPSHKYAVHIQTMLVTFAVRTEVCTMNTHFQTFGIEIVDTLTPEFHAFLEDIFIQECIGSSCCTGI